MCFDYIRWGTSDLESFNELNQSSKFDRSSRKGYTFIDGENDLVRSMFFGLVYYTIVFHNNLANILKISRFNCL